MVGESKGKNGVVTYRMNSFQALVHKGIGWIFFKFIGSRRDRIDFFQVQWFMRGYDGIICLIYVCGMFNFEHPNKCKLFETINWLINVGSSFNLEHHDKSNFCKAIN